MVAPQMRALRYVILPGKPGPRFEQYGLHDRAYTFWKEFWSGVYKALGSEHRINPDDFTRQDYLSVLMNGNDIVALHAYTIFDLRSRAQGEHSYFDRYYTKDAFERLENAGARRVMTMEYFSVAPEWRSKQVGMSLASVVAGLGVRLAKELDVDAIISVARTDIGVDKIGKAFGAEPIDRSTAHNVPVEVLSFYREKMHPHADKEIDSLVRHFWQQRTDMTSAPIIGKIAA